MRKIIKLFALALLVFFVSYNGYSGEFALSSLTFDNGGKISPKNANYGVYAGDNVSPQFTWSGAPESVKSYALVCIDTAPVANNWVHWFVCNIPSNVTLLEQGDSDDGSMPADSIQSLNSFGVKGYSGPQPPQGSGKHTYVFTLYALNVKSLQPLDISMNYEKIEAFLKPYVIAKATYSGTFER